MAVNNRADIEWAPKVRLSKIRQLYLREAQGICDDELIDAMLKYPKLIERPIVVTDKGVALGRPPEKVLEVL